MNSKDEARHSSLITTKTLCSNPANQAIWSTDTSFSDDYAAYLAMLVAIETQKIRATAITSGFTIDKLNKETLLIADLEFIMGRIQTWASRPNVNNPGVKAAATMTESQLAKLEDSLLLSKAESIKQIMIDFPAIIPTFVTPARQTTFNNRITAYEAVIEMPKAKRDERTTANKTMIDALKNAADFRKDVLAASAKVFKETQPDFYKNFTKSLKKDDNPTRMYAFKGDVRDTDSGEGIANVKILISELELLGKTGKKGNFIFKSLPAGQYTVVFSKFGFEPVTQTIFVNDGERTDLNVKMKRIAL